MEEREETTENIKRKIIKSSSSSLPVDLVLEIFLKLPMKSILRFRSVSKLWSSITTNPYFTNSFKPRPNLLLFFKEGDRFFVFTVSQHNQNPNEFYSYSSSQPIDSYQITYPKHCGFTINTESVHGLICFLKARKLVVWNPTMRKFLPLPLFKPDETWTRIQVFFGYDPVEVKHKIMCMPWNKVSNECRILTLGSDQKSWRTVKTIHKHRPFTGSGYGTASYGPCQCINGVLYYRAGMDSDRVIMSFDVRSEKFDVIKLPWEDMNWVVMIISYQGRLACLGSTGKNSLSMWVLEDAEKHEWLSYNFLPLSHYDRGSDNIFKLIGITNDGELIYVPKTVHESFHVIYIHPVRERFRRVEFRGIADKDFRQRHGLGDQPLRALQYFPNHIETLMPL